MELPLFCTRMVYWVRLAAPWLMGRRSAVCCMVMSTSSWGSLRVTVWSVRLSASVVSCVMVETSASLRTDGG